MMTPASNHKPTAKRSTALQRLRHRMMVAVIALTLAFVPMAPKPAYALVGIDDAVINYIGAAFMPGGWAQSMAGSIAATISGYFKVLMQSMRMRGEYTSAMAVADYRNEVQRVALQARIQIENIPSPNQSTCRATTALRRSSEAGAAGDASTIEQAQLRLQQMLGLGATRVTTVGGLDGGGAGGPGGGGGPSGGGGPGGNPSGGGGGTPAANGERLDIGPRGNATAASIAREQHACRYMEPTEGNKRRCKQLGVDEAQVGAGEGGGSLVGIDTNATILLDAVAFDNAAHYQAAQDFCSNITVNAQFEIPTQRVALTGIDNLKRARKGYSEAAAATFAYFICAKAIEDRIPQGNQFPAINNAASQTYAALARFGWQPLTSLTPWPPIASDEEPVPPASYASYSGGFYIPGRQPSPRQRRMISEVGLYDTTTMIGSAASPAAAMQHMLKSKAVTLSQNMDRVRQLEQQVLLAAIKLSRKVRAKGS